MRGYPFAPLDRSPSPVFSPLYLQALLSSVLRLSWPRRRLQRARRRSGRQRSCARSPGRRKSVPLGRRRSRAARPPQEPRRPTAAGTLPTTRLLLPERRRRRCHPAAASCYPPSRALLSRHASASRAPLQATRPRLLQAAGRCPCRSAAIRLLQARCRSLRPPDAGTPARIRGPMPLLIVLLLVVGFALK